MLKMWVDITSLSYNFLVAKMSVVHSTSTQRKQRPLLFITIKINNFK